MADLLVTVPKDLWFDWIDEGDAVGELVTGVEWGFWLGWSKPPIAVGERLYVAAWGRLRGYAPVTRVARDDDSGRWVICREAGAVACTLEEAIPGFRGYRKRWWSPEHERPFEGDWRTEGVSDREVRKAISHGLLPDLLGRRDQTSVPRPDGLSRT